MKNIWYKIQRSKFAKSYLAYHWSIYSALMIFSWLMWLPYYYWGKDIPPVILAVAGLMFQIPIGLFWKSFNRPILKIDGVEYNQLNVGKWFVYKINSVIVKNVGRSAAKNCKGYILMGNVWKEKTRICWSVFEERPNATINVKDDERLHVCAFYMHGIEDNVQPPKIIIPTELDWKDHYKNETFLQHPWQEFRSIKNKEESGYIRIYVTAENATSADVLVKINEVDRKIEIVEDWSVYRDNF